MSLENLQKEDWYQEHQRLVSELLLGKPVSSDGTSFGVEGQMSEKPDESVLRRQGPLIVQAEKSVAFH